MKNDSLEYKPFIEGDRIYLRSILLTDVTERYCQWMNDPGVNQFIESRFNPDSYESITEYVKELKQSPEYKFMAIIAKDETLHIGNIKIGPIDWIHRFADVSILIGEKKWWGKGLGTEAIQLVVKYAFETLNLHKLTACAYSDNIGSIRAFMKADFEEEGIRKEQRFLSGKYTNEVLLGKIRKR